MKNPRMSVALASTSLLQLIGSWALTTGVVNAAPVQCKGSGICQIPINVTIDSNEICDVQVDLDVTADKTQKRIQWSINPMNPAAQNVVFDPVQGIEFSDRSGWDVRPPGANAKRAVVMPTAAHAGAKYSINLSNGCLLDPIISNDF